jgi:ribosomal protein S18 acetylase RimI-like enzyme
MGTSEPPKSLTPRYTSDAAEYLDRVGEFLRRRPVEHSVLLSVATAHRAEAIATRGANLWLWVEEGKEVVATAQHTPPHGAYLSTGPPGAMQAFARTLWLLRPGLAGVAGLGLAPAEFAAEWSRLGGPPASPAMHLGVYAAETVALPAGVTGRLRPSTEADTPLLRRWVDGFVRESGATPSGQDQVGPMVRAGRMFVWEVDGVVVSMAAISAAEGGVSRVQYVYTPAQERNHGYASACVAALTARELATPGRTCMLYTDLANPTSNGIYQAVGYRRVGEAVDLRFDAPRTATLPGGSR